MENIHDMQVRLRKDRNTMVVVGMGVIAFGVWSVLKTVLYAVFYTENMTGQTGITGTEDSISRVVYLLTMAIILSVTMGLRLYMGLSAIAEGRGGKKRVGYIVQACLIALIDTALLVFSFTHFSEVFDSVLDMFVTAVVELTSIFIYLDLAASAIRVKRLSKKLAVLEK